MLPKGLVAGYQQSFSKNKRNAKEYAKEKPPGAQQGHSATLIHPNALP